MTYKAALKLHRLGLRVTPLKTRSKEPLIPKWPEIKIEEKDLEQVFDHECKLNIGVILGKEANGTVDVDLDCAKAATIAERFLPTTNMCFGRASKKSSHYVFSVPDAQRTCQFGHPIDGRMIVELRSTGGQTAFPDSIHPSGEEIRFEAGKDQSPTQTTFAELLLNVGYIAVSVVLSDIWNLGSRHKIALAFSGFCANNKVGVCTCMKIVGAICDIANDDDYHDRERCVYDTYRNLELGQAVAGEAALKEILGLQTVSLLRKWMSLGQKLPVTSKEKPQTSVIVLKNTTDLQFGRSFAEDSRNFLIFADQEEKFYIKEWNVYREISQTKVMGFVHEFVERYCMNIADDKEQRIAERLQSQSRMKAILEVSKTHLNVDSSQFNTDALLVGCQNGVLDLRTGALVTPDSIVTRRLGATFNPEAKCPTFEAFMNQIMPNNVDMVSYVQRAFGYGLSGLTDQQCMFLCIGSGSNGKSSMQRAFQRLAGDYASSTPMQTLTVSNSGSSNTYDIASLIGMRVVFTQEAEEQHKFSVSKLKSMTGGDVIACRAIYKDYSQYKPEFKLWAFTNELPKVPPGDDAFWRRMHIIPFNVTFSAQDRDVNLGSKLELELSGILNWAIAGFADFQQKGGLNPPDAVRLTTNSYRQDSDSVSQFVDACCNKTNDQSKFVMTSVLYQAYAEWCENSAIDPLHKNTFSKGLSRLGFGQKSTKSGNGRSGIQLK